MGAHKEYKKDVTNHLVNFVVSQCPLAGHNEPPMRAAAIASITMAHSRASKNRIIALFRAASKDA